MMVLIDQITKVITPRWGTQEYSYDDLGNRSLLKITEQGIERDISYTYDPANEMRTINESGTVTLDYDAKGNCIRKGSTSYEWNYLDQLVKVTNGSKVSQFTYDHSGRRIRKTDSSGTRYYFYNGLEPVLEFDSNGNIVKEEFSIGGELICKTIQPSAPSGIQQITYHLNDHLGSAVFILDSAGNLLANHYHDPFGKAWNVKGDIGNDVRFTGKEYEEDIGLYYFAMRWYDPEVGRFVSVDPMEPMGYVFVANNPMRYVDPSGIIKMTRLTYLKLQRLSNAGAPVTFGMMMAGYGLRGLLGTMLGATWGGPLAVFCWSMTALMIPLQSSLEATVKDAEIVPAWWEKATFASGEAGPSVKLPGLEEAITGEAARVMTKGALDEAQELVLRFGQDLSSEESEKYWEQYQHLLDVYYGVDSK